MALESLASLVGVRKRFPSAAAVALFNQTLVDLKRQGIRLVDPLDLVALGLIGLEQVVTSVPPEEAVSAAAAQGVVIQPSARPKPKTILEVKRFIAAKPQPVGPIAEEELKLPRTPLELVADERIRTIACGVASPFLLRGLQTGPPIVRGASIAALALCGFEFAEDIPIR